MEATELITMVRYAVNDDTDLLIDYLDDMIEEEPDFEDALEEIAQLDPDANHDTLLHDTICMITSAVTDPTMPENEWLIMARYMARLLERIEE